MLSNTKMAVEPVEVKNADSALIISKKLKICGLTFMQKI